MATYSFLDTLVTIVGPGGSFPLGSGAGVAKEGVSFEFNEDKNRMITGADGKIMHSLIASKSGRATVRLLKTSPTNALLGQLYTFQTQSGLNHGQNLIVLTNPTTGDEYTCQQVAFAKHPKNDYGEEAGTLEWTFDVGIMDPILGVGLGQIAA